MLLLNFDGCNVAVLLPPTPAARTGTELVRLDVGRVLDHLLAQDWEEEMRVY